MKPRSHGFALVEIMISVLIIGLLAAMAIPAVMKIRDTAIIKAVEQGKTATFDREDWVRYHEAVARSKKPPNKPHQVEESAPKPVQADFQSVEIAGKRYLLIPKQQAAETEIAGTVFWLIPSK